METNLTNKQQIVTNDEEFINNLGTFVIPSQLIESYPQVAEGRENVSEKRYITRKSIKGGEACTYWSRLDNNYIPKHGNRITVKRYVSHKEANAKFWKEAKELADEIRLGVSVGATKMGGDDGK